MGFVQDFCEKYYIMALQKEELTPINQAQLKDINFSYEKPVRLTSVKLTSREQSTKLFSVLLFFLNPRNRLEQRKI